MIAKVYGLWRLFWFEAKFLAGFIEMEIRDILW